MNSEQRTLTGRHIRRLPSKAAAKFEQKGLPIVRARYRVTGFRDLQGRWIVRNSKTGQYRPAGAARGRAIKPSDEMVRRSALVAVEVEITRRGERPVVYYTTLRGPFGG